MNRLPLKSRDPPTSATGASGAGGGRRFQDSQSLNARRSSQDSVARRGIGRIDVHVAAVGLQTLLAHREGRSAVTEVGAAGAVECHFALVGTTAHREHVVAGALLTRPAHGCHALTSGGIACAAARAVRVRRAAAGSSVGRGAGVDHVLFWGRTARRRGHQRQGGHRCDQRIHLHKDSMPDREEAGFYLKAASRVNGARAGARRSRAESCRAGARDPRSGRLRLPVTHEDRRFSQG